STPAPRRAAPAVGPATASPAALSASPSPLGVDPFNTSISRCCDDRLNSPYARRSACRSATCSREEAVGVRGALVPAPSRVAPRVLPSLRRAFPPVDGIAAVCRAALEGAAVGSAIVLREKGHWVGDDGAGGLKPSVTRASVVGPAAFVSVYARSPRSSAHRRGTPRRP